tara:strand:- start:485 stop:685 length:201 start_codon:yes stop_codon:yes gene_type:complete
MKDRVIARDNNRKRNTAKKETDFRAAVKSGRVSDVDQKKWYGKNKEAASAKTPRMAAMYAKNEETV